MKSPTIVGIVNHKGGCLKTTVTANLGAGLARVGKKVLVLDLDAQSNLTASLIGRVQYQDGMPTLFDAFLDEGAVNHLIAQTPTPGLDIVPVTEDFAGTDLSLVNVVGREFVLRNMLAKSDLSAYDFILIDNPPSISLIPMNALVASDFFLVPVSAEYLPTIGLSLLASSIEKMKRVAPRLQALGVVLTLYTHNERICRQVEQTLRREMGATLFDARIRVNTKAKSAPSVQQTIFDYESSEKGRGTEDYTKLTSEFLARLDATMERAANG